MSIARDQRQSWRFAVWFVVTPLLTLLVLFGVTVAAIAWTGVPVVASLGLLGAVLGGLVMALAIVLDTRLMEPLERLTRAARRLTAGKFEEAIHVEGLPEVNDLAAAFNEMASQLREDVDALKVERHHAAVVLASMTDGMVIVDGQLRVQRANGAAGRLLHVDPERAAGQSLATVVRDHELCQVLVTALTQGASHGAIVRLTPPATGRPGRLGVGREEPRYVRATGLPVQGGVHTADPAGLLVLQDVTELRRSESARRELVANVSHELRTPLASLKALVETLEEGALDDPPAAREFLGQMHVEVDSLAQLVQELLELSRIESGRAAFRFDSVPAAGLLAEAEGRLRMQAERAGVEVALAVPPGIPDVWADPARIVQVLINLLHNALKFTAAGGRVALRAEPDGDGVRFSVADTGVGIEPEALPRIFERFYKVDKSRASGGTGLGLAIAKHIVQAHGGDIWAESDGEGQGATLAFTLPRAPASSPEALAGVEQGGVFADGDQRPALSPQQKPAPARAPLTSP